MLDPHRPTRSRFQVLTAAFVLWALAPTSASGQDVGFTYLVQDGWRSLQSRSFADDRGMVYHGTGRHSVFEVVNGQKMPGLVAIADVSAWARHVPDPYFAPISPLAGLIVLDFFSEVWHLALIDTPVGPRTTIGVHISWWFVDPAVSGSWVFSDGASVAGGTADDLLIAGVAHYAPYSHFGSAHVGLVPHSPPPPFVFDPTPGGTHPVGDGTVRMGSFYGAAGSPFALTPVRSFTTADSGWPIYGTLWAHVVAIHVTGDTYFVVACSIDPTPPLHTSNCTVSGTGAFAGYTGEAIYPIVGEAIKLWLSVYATY